MPGTLPRSDAVAAARITERRRPILAQVDPRARIVAAVVFSLLVAVSSRWTALGLALVAAVVAAGAAGMGWAGAARRLAALEAMMLMLAAVVPWTTPGAPLVSVGTLAYSREGLVLAGRIALEANAIVLALAALVGTLELPALGHALAHLRVPEKLVHLLLFSARYFEVLHREYARLRTAMRSRAFRAGWNRHTLGTYGHLVGMLLVRALDRAERITAAMKCRGFRGRFYLLDHFAWSGADGLFAAVAVAVLAAVAWIEWA